MPTLNDGSGITDQIVDQAYDFMGVGLLEDEIDDVIFQTNQFLLNSDFIGSNGPFWWLAHFTCFHLFQIVDTEPFAKFCSVKQISDGTKTGQNHRKIKSRTLFVGHPLP